MIINYISINQTETLISLGTDKGFIIKNLENKVLIKNDIGLVNIIEIYYNSNIFFIVKNNRKILNIYDDNIKKIVFKIEKVRHIELIKIVKDYIIISVNKEIYIYDIYKLNILKIINTNNLILDCKMNYLIYKKNNKYIEVLNIKNNNIINNECHSSNIQLIKLSRNLKYILTISEYGRIIKIFDFNTLQLIREYIRGITKSLIKYADFDINEEKIFIYSENNTLHIYKINEKNEIFFSYEYSKYKIKLEYKNILCVLNKEILYIINVENGLIDKYEYIKHN